MNGSANFLAVGFVTPAFIAAGALLVSIPIIIHLLNRRRFKTVEWAAMEFLLRAMRKNRRRIRFEQWLLLAVRCGVLLLLGIALSRPLGCTDTSLAALAARRAGLHVIVIDNSYSMLYESDRPDAKTNLDQAKVVAKKLIDRFSSGGESVVVITAARPATAVLASPSYDLAQAKSAIERVEQSYSGTDLAGALDLALKIGQEQSRQPNRYLYLLTDATRSAWDVGRAQQAMQSTGRELGKVYQHVSHFNLAKPGAWNAAVVEVKPGSNLLRRGYANDVVTRVLGFGNTRDAQVLWKLDDQALPGGDAIRPTPDAPPITQSRFQLTRGGPHVFSVTFASDDRLPIDDTRTRVIDVASDVKVLIVEGERGVGSLGGSGAFLMEALAPAIDPTVAPENGASAPKRASYVAPELISDIELSNKVLTDYRAIVLAGVGQLSTNQADQLQRFVEAGGTLMLFMGEPVSGEAYNSTLLPRKLLPGPLVKRVSVTGGRNAFTLDFKPDSVLDPLLRKFERLPKSGLDRAAIYTYWQIDLPRDSTARRVLNYTPDEKGHADPAITVHDVGRGHVLFVSTSAYPDWSSLPGRLNFAPLVHELLAGTMTAGDDWMNLSVGDELRVPPTVQLTAAPALKDPQQADVVMEQTTTEQGQPIYHSRPLARPGLYTLVTGSAKYPVSVNVPGEEADVRPVDDATIRRALGDIEIEFQTDQVPAIADVNQPGNDFGWAVMVAVLGFVGAECFLAMRFGHYRRGTAS